MSAPRLPESLVTFVQVLSEDEDLRAWFDSFGDVSEGNRAEHFRLLAKKMQAAGEHPDLISATALLGERGIYDAVRMALVNP